MLYVDPKRFADLSVVESSLGSVPVSSNGQLVPVTDQPGKYLYVRNGGALKPVIDVANLPNDVRDAMSTTGHINMTVDPAGTSPPAGTVVRNQAEYDALGYSLKYCQDVLDILPTNIDHVINVSLVAGTHLAKPGSMGTYPGVECFLWCPPFHSSSKESRFLVGLGLVLSSPGISFTGANSDVETGIAGTSTTWTFTRSSGSWTVNEHRGQFIYITSGAGAGTRQLIRSNTDTTLTLASEINSVGSCTLTIYELSSVCLSSLNGVNPTTYGLYFNPRGEASFRGVVFSNVKFGNASLPFSDSQMQGTFLQMVRCNYYGGLSVNVYQNRPEVIVQFVYVELPVGKSWYFAGASFTTYGLIFAGNPGSGYMLNTSEWADVPSAVNTWFDPDSGFTGVCWQMEHNCAIDPNGPIQMNGNGVCTGLRVFGGNTSLATFQDVEQFTINNCAIGVKLDDTTFLFCGQGFNTTSTGNTIGWQLVNSTLQGNHLNHLGATTTDVDLNGTAVPYSLLANPGDKVTAANGLWVAVL